VEGVAVVTQQLFRVRVVVEVAVAISQLLLVLPRVQVILLRLVPVGQGVQALEIEQVLKEILLFFIL
jgi:hypothetical protein